MTTEESNPVDKLAKLLNKRKTINANRIPEDSDDDETEGERFQRVLDDPSAWQKL